MEQLQSPLPQEDRTAKMKSAYSRGGLGIGALYGILQVIGSLFLIVGAVIVSIPLVRRLDNFPLDGIGSILALLRDSGTIAWLVAIYVAGMIVGMTVGLIVLRVILPKRTPIERQALSPGTFLWIALAAYGLWGIGVAVGNLPSFFGVEEQSTVDQLLEGLQYGAIPLYLYTVIGAPIFEELACRKLLLDCLHPYGEGFAVVVSALLFGLIHGNSGQFFLAFLLGLLFAMVYLRTGNLLYTILLHGMINLTATIPDILAIFGVSGDRVVLIWNIAVISLSILGLIVLMAKRKDTLLQPRASEVPDATRAVWRSVGMMIVRIAGLVLLVLTDLLLMLVSLLSGQNAALLRLIPTSLAVLLVVLLPRLTRRFASSPMVPASEVQHGIETEY